MATAMKRCKVCGKEYEYCRTTRHTDIFRWQDVACSPLHASEYFHNIAISRGQITEDSSPTYAIKSTQYNETDDADVELDEESDDFDYDDSDEDLFL